MAHNLVTLQREFVNLRNGVFIHFNSATQQFHDSKVEDWDYGITDKNDPERHVFDPKTWNPKELNCQEWAEVAKNGKANFAALTAKHHEGFCLWPTKTTEHSVTNASYQEDVVDAYLNAFREAGIMPGLYFSMLDLQHHITETKCNQTDKEFIKAQLTELLTNYGEIPFLIVDGWNAPWGGPSFDDLPFMEVNQWVKTLQPRCLLMNIGSGMDMTTTDIVFFENAAGQEPPENFVGPGASCNIYTQNWFWKERDTMSELKSVEWAVKEKVEKDNQKNITYLMNISPNKDGRVDDNLKERFRQFGQMYHPLPAIDQIPLGWLVREGS